MANFNIYKASAGSGKTYTLVREYIKKCISSDSHISHKPLLAITFTNKAAAEMKSRIISTLFAFSIGEKIDFYEELKTELSYTDQDFQQKSKKALSDIIHYYSSFSVSTIDKFIHSIIRNFSYELDLPSNFEVEMDSKKLIKDAVFSLLDDIGVDNTLTSNLVDFSEYKTTQDRHWDIEKDLLDLGKELFKDRIFLLLNKIPSLDKIQKEKKGLVKEIISFEKGVQNYYNQIKTILKNIPDEAFIYKALPSYLRKIKHKLYKELAVKQHSRLYNCIVNQAWYSKSSEQNLKNKIDSISNELKLFFDEYLVFLETKYPEYLFYTSYYNSLFLMSVLTKINEKIQTNKKENSIIHISEFNQIIHYFLTNTSAPFIYEKIGNRYHHHFIDEFQDTSTIQWQNLLPLIENSLSFGGSCLLVGDGKQSIYRWRGGEVEQFLALCNKNDIHPLKQFEPSIHSLEINRRSATKIVEFNNDFFSFLAQYLYGDYNNLYHNLSQKKYIDEDGYVELDIISPQDSKLVLPKTLDQIHSTILDLKQDNYDFSDIFILTRTNHEITKIATYLSEHNVPVISSEALLLNSSETIHFLINILRILLNEEDIFSRARVIEYLIINKIIKTENQNFSELLYNYSRYSNIDFQVFLQSKSINFDLHKYVNLNLYELTENLIRDFNLNVKHNLFITFFLDFVLDYTVTQNNSIRDFLQQWELKKDTLSIIIPNGIDAVEIMTIHKSKGLEFPIVIFPFANWKEDLGLENHWFPLSEISTRNKIFESEISLLPIKREFEKWPTPFPNYYNRHKQNISLDSINLLYVALTRAKNRLYIYPNIDPRKGTIYKYFNSFLENKKHKNFQKFILGKKIKKQFSDSKKAHKITNNFISYNWRNRLKIKQKYSFNKDIKIKYAINWGHLIHNIMSDINTKKDIEPILTENLQKRLINQEAFNRIKKEVLSILNNPKITHLFKPGLEVFAENSILSKHGVFRPDRVVLHSKNKVSIIDYKTGEKRKSDIVQMDNYEKILLNMGYQNIEKYLVYLTESNVEKL